jgi:hypothetical protein
VLLQVSGLARRVDNTQREITAALRAAGCSVAILSDLGRGVPDLIVATPAGDNILIEIKSPGGKLTPAEAEFIAGWLGPVFVVSDIDQALTVIRGA